MVDYSKQGSIAVLTVNNPPVNALSHYVRTGLYDSFERAAKDKDIVAVVLCGNDQTFPAGADISEFGQKPKEPMIIEVGKRIESMEKPVVAAIHGTCLGGGLELALFCHYRIALEKSRVGFPEVLIGIIPGAGGTQLLPRVAGLQVAMEMITTGRHVPVKEAEKYNIIDKVVTGDIVNEGIKFVIQNTRKSLNDRRLRNRVPHDKDKMETIIYSALLKIKKKSSGVMAPLWSIKSVLNSVRLPFEDGLAGERTMYLQLQMSGQAKALQYAFFAECTITKWQLPCGGNSGTAIPLKIKTVSVIGAGTMGTGITVALLSAGIPVLLVEQNKELLLKGLGAIKSILVEGIRRGKSTGEQVKLALSQLTSSINFEDLHSVDLVVEAVYENLALKLEIFAKLSKICKPDAILCTNTSFLDIDKIAASTNRPGKVVGTHFFSPAHIMRLLENIYGSRTTPETVATVMNLGRKIGKVPVLVGTCHGFCANRLISPQVEEALFMVEEGASIQQIDQVMEDFGMPIGPFKVRDLAGGDIIWRSRKDYAQQNGITLNHDTNFFNGNRYSSLADKLCELGRFGQKTGSGWYYYGKPGSKEPFIDDDVTKLIVEHRASVGIIPQRITPQEIQERILYSLINEGFKILQDGIAARPEHIDIVCLYGFGFPRHYGGPMFYANQVGLKTIYDRICCYHKMFSHSSHWVPSKLLEKLATDKVPINQWMKAMQSKL